MWGGRQVTRGARISSIRWAELAGPVQIRPFEHQRLADPERPPRRRQRVEYFEHPRRGGVEARPLVGTQRSAHPPGLAQRRLLRRAVGTQTAAPFDVEQEGKIGRASWRARVCQYV